MKLRLVLFLGVVLLAGSCGLWTSAARGGGCDCSPYRWYNCTWWYYHPDGGLSYWQNNQWNDYRSPTVPAYAAGASPAGAPQPYTTAYGSYEAPRAVPAPYVRSGDSYADWPQSLIDFSSE